MGEAGDAAPGAHRRAAHDLSRAAPRTPPGGGSIKSRLLALAVALGVIIFGGCAVHPPQVPAAAARPSAAPAAKQAPAKPLVVVPPLKPGTYALVSRDLPLPVWAQSLGTSVGVLPAAGKGVWAGTLTGPGRGAKARLEMTGQGPTAKGKLSTDIDLGSGNQATEWSASVSAAAGPALSGAPTTRLVFRPLEVPPGRERVAIGAEVPSAGSVRMSWLVSSVWELQVPVAAAPAAAGPPLAFITAPVSGSGSPLVYAWLDADQDGEISPGETASLGPKSILALGGKLFTVALDKPEKGKVQVAAWTGPVATVKFDARDGSGAPAAVLGPQFVTAGGLVSYLGANSSAEVPAGRLSLSYLLPLGGGAAAEVMPEASGQNLTAGKTVTVKVGGPVKIKLDANSPSAGQLTVAASLTTATGDSITSFAGEGDHGGLLEVLGPGDKLLATHKLEFG